MLGLALEGGAARGAYHVGVVKALLERGFAFDGYVGTSIGAINAAALAQGEFENLHEMWLNISVDKLFDEDAQKLFIRIETKDFKPTPEILAEIRAMLARLKSGGIGTERLRELLDTHINEEKIRLSGKDYGLVTLSVTDLKPYRLMLEDIPPGKLVDYIMASAAFPGFRPQTIDDKVFLDGALYDNCPYQLLLERGYDEVIAVRTNAPGVFRRAQNMEKVRIIESDENLGSQIVFSKEHTAANIERGYRDGLKFNE